MGMGVQLNGKETRADVFMRAFESLSRAEKGVVASRLLDDPELREEVLDIGLNRQCDSESALPLEKQLSERGADEG